MSVCVLNSNNRPQPTASWTPPWKGFFVWGGVGGGVMGWGIEDRGGHSLLPAHSFWTRSHQSPRRTFLPLSSCCYLRLYLPITASSAQTLASISVSCPSAIMLSLFYCPPQLIPPPPSQSFFFSCQYRLPLSSLGTVHWADPAGAVATKQAMHSWHHVRVDGWDAGWGCSVRV